MRTMDIEGWQAHPLSKYVRADDRVRLLEGTLNQLKNKNRENNRILDHQINNTAQWLTTPEAHNGAESKKIRDGRLGELYSQILASNADPITQIDWLTKLFLGNETGAFNKELPYLNPTQYLAQRNARIKQLKDTLPTFIESCFPGLSGIVRSPEKIAIAEKLFVDGSDRLYQTYRDELDKDGPGFAIKYAGNVRKAYNNWEKVKNSGDMVS